MKMLGAVLAIVTVSAAPMASNPITFVGIGPVKVGERVSTIEKALGLKLSESEMSTSDESCRQYQIGNDESLVLMAEDGIVTRVETWDSRFRTASGARVGDTEARVRRLYGKRLVIDAHQYDDSGHYFIVRSNDGKFALVMETDGKRVTGIRAGLLPSAEYVEGCL